MTGVTTRISTDTLGNQADNSSLYPSISSDGRYVAFCSYATNLVGNDTNGEYDIFLKDTQTGTTTRVSVDSSENQTTGSAFSRTSISSDGRYVAFRSSATNLVSGDTNGTYDIFVRDTVAGTTMRVNVSESGDQANGGSENPSISADGSYVVFQSNATNLHPDDRTLTKDVFAASPEMDFGDAPWPYPTFEASDGARHRATGPTLGTNRDTEWDGQPTTVANGDDEGTSDDEDGITFGSTIMVGQLDASVMVNVQNAPSGAKLDAWIDFNADGTWGGPFEQIADTVAVVNGDNTITFDVPSWAVDGDTYARFRLSTTGDLAPTGQADDGEVEDCQVTIVTPTPSIGAFGDQNPIC